MSYVNRFGSTFAVYNENDDYAADWLENLIRLGAIAPGAVDRRSIVDVRPGDYREFRQAHFFAGIGVWSYALRCAGVPDDIAVWTGSCPCQPFSAAGAGGGMDDERHLWPHWFHLIEAERPARIYGEQVASKDGLGWLDLVQADLEAAGYSVWAVDTCSAGSGAPHIRQRLRICADDTRSAAGWFLDASRKRYDPRRRSSASGSRLGEFGFGDAGDPMRMGLTDSDGLSARGQGGSSLGQRGSADTTGGFSWLVDGIGSGLEGQRNGHRPETGQREGSLRPITPAGGLDWLADDLDQQRQIGESGIGPSNDPRGWQQGATATAGFRSGERMADDSNGGRGEERQNSRGVDAGDRAEGWTAGSFDGWLSGDLAHHHHHHHHHHHDGRGAPTIPELHHEEHHAQPRDGFAGRIERAGPTNGFWRDADWLFCRDGKWRPVEPGTFPLVDGASFRLGSGSPFEGKSRQGILKGYGNAIDAEATIDFIRATLPGRDSDLADGALIDLTSLLA